MKKFMTFSFTVCTMVLLVITGSAQVIDKSGKQNPSVNYERLARIDELVNSYVKKDWVKGVVTIIVKDNQLIQYKGYGHLDVKSKKDMPNDAIFRQNGILLSGICLHILPVLITLILAVIR